MDRFTHLALAAARQAEADAKLDIAPEADRIGAAVATGIGGLKSFEACIQVLDERGPDRVNPFSIVQIIPNLAAGWVSMELGTKGPLLSECTACAASNMAIGDGLRRDPPRPRRRHDLRRHRGARVPGRDRGLRRDASHLASQRRPEARRRRPFDLERDGFVMGEAAAMVVLEELEHANARGAKIYAELLGYGLSSDATHVSDPDPTGESPARALQMAFDDAGITPDEVGYVNAHGTSTPARRRCRDARDQARARRGEGVRDAGLVDEGRDRALPRRGGRGRGDLHDPRARARRAAADDQLRGPDPECDLDYIPNEARDAAGRGRRLQLVRLRRPQRLRRLPPLARRTPIAFGAERGVGGERCQNGSRRRETVPTSCRPSKGGEVGRTRAACLARERSAKKRHANVPP